jgi:hypothetical protein
LNASANRDLRQGFEVGDEIIDMRATRRSRYLFLYRFGFGSIACRQDDGESPACELHRCGLADPFGASGDESDWHLHDKVSFDCRDREKKVSPELNSFLEKFHYRLPCYSQPTVFKTSSRWNSGRPTD